MEITSHLEDGDSELVITINERFDFSQYRDFKEAYSSYNTPGTSFIVDLRKTEYMDSSALGMLLVLKEHADAIGGAVRLRHPSPTIVSILEVTNFDSLFKYTD